MFKFVYDDPTYFILFSLGAIFLLLVSSFILLFKIRKEIRESKECSKRVFLTTTIENIFVIFKKTMDSLEENRKYVIPNKNGYKEPAVLMPNNEITGTSQIKESIREYLEKGEIDKIHALFARISEDENLTYLLKEMTSNFTTWSKNWKNFGYM